MTQGYRDALLEYLALSKLEDDLRVQTRYCDVPPLPGEDRGYDLRTEVSGRKNLAREKLEKLLLPRS